MAECQDIEKVNGAFAILDLGKAQCFACILGSCLDIACAVAQCLDIIQSAFDIGIGVQHGGPVIGERNAPVRFSRINTRRGQAAIKQRSGEPDAEGEGERCRIDEVAKVGRRTGDAAGQRQAGPAPGARDGRICKGGADRGFSGNNVRPAAQEIGRLAGNDDIGHGRQCIGNRERAVRIATEQDFQCAHGAALRSQRLFEGVARAGNIGFGKHLFAPVGGAKFVPHIDDTQRFFLRSKCSLGECDGIACINGHDIGAGDGGGQGFAARPVNGFGADEIIFGGEDIRADGAPEISFPARADAETIVFRKVGILKGRGARGAGTGTEAGQEARA